MIRKIIIDNGIFPWEGYFVYGTDKPKALKLINKISQGNFTLDHLNSKGVCFNWRGRYIIYMTKFPSTSDEKSTLAHEVFHAVYAVLEHAGIRLTYESEETFAYLTSHITKQIYESRITKK